MTKRENFVALKEMVSANAEMVAFIDKEIALLDKKNSKDRKPSAKQLENAKILPTILEVMARIGEPVRVKELCAEPEFKDFTIQKVSAMMKKLVDAKEISRFSEKRETFFELYVEDEDFDEEIDENEEEIVENAE